MFPNTPDLLCALGGRSRFWGWCCFSPKVFSASSASLRWILHLVLILVLFLNFLTTNYQLLKSSIPPTRG